MNGLSVCLDEIALEGLDGITLSTLWKRLNNATLRSTLDNSYKAFLWNSVLSSQEVKTFFLEEPREELEDFTDDAKIYPFCIVNDETSGVRGSCSTFKSRKLVDLSNKNLDFVEENYGNRLVLVASQDLRERVLLDSEVESSVEVTDPCYCLLEWVGRARKVGRLQSCSTSYTGIEVRTVFHHLKVLNEQHMITKQPVSDGTVKTSILYLPKFHVEHVKDCLASKICSVIGKMSGKCASVEYLCSYLCQPPLSILKSLSELVSRGHIQYVHADASDINNMSAEESKSLPMFGHEGKKSMHEVVKLVKPFYNMLNDEEEEVEDEIFPVSKQDLSLKIPAEVPVLDCVYQTMESKGIKGMTYGECCESLGLPFYCVRAVLHQLESQQKATVIFEDVGRQRINRYIATKIFKEHQNVMKEPTQKKSQLVQPTLLESSKTNDTCEDIRECSQNPCSSHVNILETTKNQHVNLSGFTEKLQKRRKIVTDFLSKHKVVEGEYILRRLIIDKEAESGLAGVMDKKTNSRLLNKLKNTGSIQIFDIDVEVDSENHTLQLICDPKIKKDSPQVLAKINACKKNLLEKKRIKEAGHIKVVKKETTNSTKLGLLPKMPRAEMLHIFLYFLVYELAKPDVNLEAWRQKYEWAEHLTPSHSPQDYGEGWFTAASILMLLPLSLYVRLVGVVYEVNILDQYLNNPETKNMLLQDLPPSVRHYLFDRKRNLPSFLESFQLLAEMNLITPTTKIPFLHAKDILCHLNKKAVLLDTRASSPGYYKVKHPEGGQFPETVYMFLSLSDVNHYWSSMRDICLATHLGAKGVKSSSMKRIKKKTLKDFLIDEENLHVKIKPHGDGLGASGFDSGMFIHLRRNWTWTKIGRDKPSHILVEDTTGEDWQLCFTTATVPAECVSKNTGGKGLKRKRSQPMRNEKPPKKAKASDSDPQKSGKPSQGNPDGAPEVSMTRKKKPSIVSRSLKMAKKVKVKAKKVRTRGHWGIKCHDKRDFEAQKRKEVIRVTFTPQEQKLLFICTLALRILGKKSTDTGYSDWLWTRDVLYRDNYESAKTKTALSISRKYRTIMKDPQNKTNLNICTADCVQEKEFLPFCNLGKTCDEATFNELVELLKRKYSLENLQTKPLCLPYNMRTFLEQVNIQSSLQPRNQKKFDGDIASLKVPVAALSDVRQGILRDSIISALVLEDEKYDPNAAYVFLDQFAEEELSTAIGELKRKNIVTRKTLRYGQGRNLALVTFSQTLSVPGQRILDAHLPSSMVSETISFLNQVKQGGSHSRTFISSNSAVEESVKPRSLTLSDNSLLGGHVACILSLLSAGKLSVEMDFPENILQIELPEKKNNLEGNLVSSVERHEEHETLVSQDVPQKPTEAKKLQREKESILISTSKEALSPKESSSNVVSQDTFTSKSKDVLEAIYPVDQTDGTEPLSIGSPLTSRISEEDEGKCSVPRELVGHQALSERVEANNSDEGHISNLVIRSVTTENGKPLSRGPILTSKDDRVLGSSNFYHEQNVSKSFLDVLSGIEDHLFGNFGQSVNIPARKVDLQSKSSFICHIGSITQMGGNSSPADIIYDDYNKKIVPARMAGSLIRPLIRTNPSAVKLSLLPSTGEESRQTKQSDAKGLVAEYFRMNAHRFPERLDECLGICSKEFGFVEEDCKALAEVYKNIENGKEIGVARSKLVALVKQCAFLSKFSITGLIDVLKAFNLVHEVGFVEVRFVTQKFKTHWSLPFPCVNICHAPSEVQNNRNTCLIDNNQEMVSCGTQTDILLANPLHICSEAEKKHDVVHDESTVAQSGLSLEEHHKEKASVLQDKSLVSDSPPLDDSVLRSVPEPIKLKELPAEVQKQLSSPISRPWFCMDGQINKTAYNCLHESVLRYVMRYPGVEEFTIAKHFVDMIFPVTLQCILQTLENNQCVFKRSFIKKHPATLFPSQSCKDSVEESKVTYYLPAVDALLKLIEHVLM